MATYNGHNVHFQPHAISHAWLNNWSVWDNIKITDEFVVHPYDIANVAISCRQLTISSVCLHYICCLTRATYLPMTRCPSLLRLIAGTKWQSSGHRKDFRISSSLWGERKYSDHDTEEFSVSLQWRHNGCDGVSNHQPHDCLLNRLFSRRSKWSVNSPHKGLVTREMFPFDYFIIGDHDIENISVLAAHCGVNTFMIGHGYILSTKAKVMWSYVLLLVFTTCWTNSSVAGVLNRHGVYMTSQ